MSARRLLRLVLRGDSGQGLTEYAIMLAVALLGAGFALLVLRDSLGNVFQGTRGQIEAATVRDGTGDDGSGGSAGEGQPASTDPAMPDDPSGRRHHGNGKGNSGRGRGNGGPNGRKD